MSAVDEIETAIARLEAVKSSADGIAVEAADDRDQIGIDVLYATIDAQLAILQAAADDFKQYGGKPSKFFENDLALARAINGVSA